MRKVLGPEFFERPTLTVAKELLGKYLIRKVGKKEAALMIVETEAYDGEKDLACHARNGQTERNAPMFGPPGRAYVYFAYGMHWMLNLVTGKEGYPAAVLIRAIFRQGLTLPTSGPGKLTKYLQIDKKLNTLPLTKKSGLWVEDRGVKVRLSQIQKGPRVGVDYAGPYATKPWRFVLKPERLLVHARRRVK